VLDGQKVLVGNGNHGADERSEREREIDFIVFTT
jgi:hypothetical protein